VDALERDLLRAAGQWDPKQRIKVRGGWVGGLVLLILQLLKLVYVGRKRGPGVSCVVKGRGGR
jgi:hypothetical protein